WQHLALQVDGGDGVSCVGDELAQPFCVLDRAVAGVHRGAAGVVEAAALDQLGYERLGGRVHAFQVVDVERADQQVDGRVGGAQVYAASLVDLARERERPLLLDVRAGHAVQI